MKKIISILLAAVMLAIVMVGCSSTDNNKLIVGTNAEFVPFEYVDDDGNIDGFDIALMKEVGKKLDMEVVIENMEFKGLIGAIDSEKINVIAAGMTIDEERKQTCDFTDPYIQSKQVVIVKKGNTAITKEEDLKGKVIAVQEGTTGDFIATDDAGAKEVLRFKKYLDAVKEVENGKADAVIIDSAPADKMVEANSNVEIVKDLVMADEEYGIAVKKGNTELLEKINTAISELKADGTFDKLVDEYINN